MECIVDGEIVGSFKIKKTDESIEVLTEEIINVLSKIIKRIPKDKKFEFMFIED